MAKSSRRELAMRRALELITEAMDLLDAHDGEPDLAAHLALVQERLRRTVGSGDNGSQGAGRER